MRRGPRAASSVALGLALGIVGAGKGARAAPPEVEREAQQAEADPVATGSLRGRVVEAGGSRAPVSAAVVMLVDAPADVRPGKPARAPLDPEAVTWLRRVETDAEGRFEIDELPVGKARVVVVAGGYLRLEQWVEVEAGERELKLFVEPESGGAYRTEVVTEREQLVEPLASIDGEQGRRYAGSGDDPLMASLNMPGVARSPGGVGLLSFRGGDPRQTGYIVDNHPIPRAFHIVPVAGVVSPMMIDRVDMYPGNYAPSFGGFGAGMVHIHSRSQAEDGVHGEAHLDLFDLGGAVSAPLGPGSIRFGARRSHVDGVIRGAGRIEESLARRRGPGSQSFLSTILLPKYWDYLGRLDMPVRAGHSLSVRALGAGDRIEGQAQAAFPGQPPGGLDFSAAFHRFDLEYAGREPGWRSLLSSSVRLDSSSLLRGVTEIRRNAFVFSHRMFSEHDLGEHLSLQIGMDVYYERWRRGERLQTQPVNPDQAGASEGDTIERNFAGDELKHGMWVSATLRFGEWKLTPSLRANLFSYGKVERFSVDPRLDLRGEITAKLGFYGRLGMYSIPLVATQPEYELALIPEQAYFYGGIADIPSYLIYYFDPGIEAQVRDGALGLTQVVHASTGFEVELPWALDLRVGGFWREQLRTSVPVKVIGDNESQQFDIEVGRQRAMGLELLLRRRVTDRLDGWIGYTLNWARVERRANEDRGTEDRWLPAIFDQRHNLNLMLSVKLPRGFRFGARFRLVSGNPDRPVLGSEADARNRFGWSYNPLRGPRGASYRPVFHQLDLRLDKDWTLRRTTVTAYLDVQNVYDNRYPEVWVYTADWRERSSLVGLPIFPSFGVQVKW